MLSARVGAYMLSAFAIAIHVAAEEASSEQGLHIVAARDGNLLVSKNVRASMFPSRDPHHSPPPGSTRLFELSQKYPSSYKLDEVFPWEAIDFRAHPEAYLRSILRYAIEGNEDVDFRVQDNPVRKWYHAPWLHDDGEPNGAGREYHHGLTRERRSRPHELHPSQSSFAQNWAVGIVNDRGGYTLGKVWQTGDGFPDPSRCTFPEHAVSFKLLFTDASVEEVPFLKASKVWTANIYRDTNYTLPRVDREVRLLQIDIAVKEPRVAEQAGWIFGTFIYNGDAAGTDIWDRMEFVGISWSDDENVRDLASQDGAFENTSLTSTILNTALLESRVTADSHARMRHHGLGGRLNGPVDSPVSSCISCHSRAGTYAFALPLRPESGLPLEFVVSGARKPSEFPISEFARFFSDIRPNSHLQSDQGQLFVTTDYSLQVSAGIRNFYENLRQQPEVVRTLEGGGAGMLDTFQQAPPLPKVTRGE